MNFILRHAWKGYLAFIALGGLVGVLVTPLLLDLDTEYPLWVPMLFLWLIGALVGQMFGSRFHTWACRRLIAKAETELDRISREVQGLRDRPRRRY